MSFISDADHVLGEEMYNNTRGNPNIAFTRYRGTKRHPNHDFLTGWNLRHLDHAKLRTLLPTASEAVIIAYKRRLNTLAARKSRKRKLEHLQMLEAGVEAEIIAYKRRLNTLAAWKSRERKLEDVQALSTLIDLFHHPLSVLVHFFTFIL
ncbi:hypothetical protein B0H11DRAFT_2284559 [Mycena galericulata]|nr:hypothetical protein B0H11DRAFT_2284559 [Mycena galericulata]